MAKFQFRMATLLRLREAARDQRRAELAEAYRVEALLHTRQQQVQQELTWLREQCRRTASPGVVQVDRLIESQRYEVVLRTQQKALERQRAAVTEEIERRRQALVESDREVRTLEKLRERQLEKHRQDEERRATKQLDEIAQRRAVPQEVV